MVGGGQASCWLSGTPAPEVSVQPAAGPSPSPASTGVPKLRPAPSAAAWPPAPPLLRHSTISVPTSLPVLRPAAGVFVSFGVSTCAMVGGQLSKALRTEQPGGCSAQSWVPALLCCLHSRTRLAGACAQAAAAHGPPGPALADLPRPPVCTHRLPPRAPRMPTSTAPIAQPKACSASCTLSLGGSPPPSLSITIQPAALLL